jgi:RNA recognition motif-containing protein
MGSKIYVGGLPYSATEQELSDLFGKHGSLPRGSLRISSRDSRAVLASSKCLRMRKRRRPLPLSTVRKWVAGP